MDGIRLGDDGDLKQLRIPISLGGISPTGGPSLHNVGDEGLACISWSPNGVYLRRDIPDSRVLLWDPSGHLLANFFFKTLVNCIWLILLYGIIFSQPGWKPFAGKKLPTRLTKDNMVLLDHVPNLLLISLMTEWLLCRFYFSDDWLAPPSLDRPCSQISQWSNPNPLFEQPQIDTL